MGDEQRMEQMWRLNCICGPVRFEMNAWIGLFIYIYILDNSPGYKEKIATNNEISIIMKVIIKVFIKHYLYILHF